ncbi:MAG: zf-HC2 domain-containing protein [Lachnospiraceae bacterium]|nr:zf-HC2 domain-containing protein [Lachnospiraceae bacterium]
MNLSCSVVQDLIVLFQENTVSEETRRDIRAHLKECRECRRVYREYSYLNHEEVVRTKEPENVRELQFAEIAARLRKNRNWYFLVVSTGFALGIGVAVMATRAILKGEK